MLPCAQSRALNPQHVQLASDVAAMACVAADPYLPIQVIEPAY
jgi:hypothetical protein